MLIKSISIVDNDLYLQESFKEKFLNFCRTASKEIDEPAHRNMFSQNWNVDPNTLPYHIYVSNRFKKNGNFFIGMINEEIIAASGVYVSEFDKNVAIGGVRSWVNKKYRGKFIIGRHLLPLQLFWAKEKKLKTIALTFNEYNKRLLPYFRRSGFGIKKNRNVNSLFYNGLHEVSHPLTIQHTKQWAIYHKIDETYDPVWEKIKWVENSDK